MSTRPSGFTLVELLIAIAIICLLIALSVVATLQARLRARDSQRISHATTIMNALESYYAAHRAYPDLITPGQPIRLGSTTLLEAVPSNPFPRTDGGCADQTYTYTTTSTGYELTFCLGADHGRFSKGIVVCKNGNCGVRSDFVCGDPIVDSEGISYPTVQIGTQCWMAQDLKSKRRPNGTCINTTQGSYIVNSDCLIIGPNPYSYDPNFLPPTIPSPVTLPGYQWSRRDCVGAEFDSGGMLGLHRGIDAINYSQTHPTLARPYSDCAYRSALYRWSGAMNLPDACDLLSPPPGTCVVQTPHQGICPTGWHIPTDQEFYTLELYLTDSPNPCDINRPAIADQCRNAGTKLKIGGGSGFEALLVGGRTHVGGDEFIHLGTGVDFWTADSKDLTTGFDEAAIRILTDSTTGVYKQYKKKYSAFPVRCLKDN